MLFSTYVAYIFAIGFLVGTFVAVFCRESMSFLSAASGLGIMCCQYIELRIHARSANLLRRLLFKKLSFGSG